MLSKALAYSVGGAIHCIRTAGAGIANRVAKVTLRHEFDGRMDIVFKQRLQLYTSVRRLPGAAAIEDHKTIDARLDQIIARHDTRPRSPWTGNGSGG